MRKLEEIDKNFKVETKINKNDVVFRSVMEKPFSVHGLIYEDGKFCRMPKQVASSLNMWISHLNCNTAGGRVRFKTDSSYIAIHAKMSNIGKMDHFALTGSAGFDMYVSNGNEYKYNNTFRPPFDVVSGYESVFDFESKEMREIIINFPLYSDVKMLYIGTEDGAEILEPTPYSYDKPMVYYGHSITQGACATRPGNTCSSILSRKFSIDYINLGFSGNARGEKEIAEYISALDMKIFVYDYDHNASCAKELEETHEKMFKTVRRANPDLPIIIMTSTTKPSHLKERALRRDIIFKTYENAVNSGDKNVYFWDGGKEFAPHEDYGTVEGVHLNDYGFVAVADSLSKVIEQILK